MAEPLSAGTSSPHTHVRVTGEGRPVVLIAGGASTCFDYFPGVEAGLKDVAQVITCDPPGIGRRRDSRPLRLSTVAAGLAGTLDELSATGCVLVAHSIGGPVALRIALDFPDRVSSLVLLDPTPIAPRAARMVGSLLATMRRLGPAADLAWRRAARRELHGRALGPDGQAAMQVYCARRFCRESARWCSFERDAADLAADLAATPVTVPVLVVSAGHHKPTSPIREGHLELVDLLPQGSVEIWPGTSHTLHMQVPERVVGTVLHVLEQP